MRAALAAEADDREHEAARDEARDESAGERFHENERKIGEHRPTGARGCLNFGAFHFGLLASLQPMPLAATVLISDDLGVRGESSEWKATGGI